MEGCGEGWLWEEGWGKGGEGIEGKVEKGLCGVKMEKGEGRWCEGRWRPCR